ncbi:conserved protein of unknown function [Candidatus Filomicrobium marinum]|uniref:Uncharacterized protein n=1 Tax=Candidatus Filomicrobium marinum TaxID=1608628 RepID=A0A0D6JDP3_9HYPH|nr:hypothetical protein [Candidatus Filomicrobium marinum]CFX11345.1 conserved protein of unknown function [Candidatus Filomicrobium marinum]CPR17263.1 conserved protein of unknown function [Candidatus Filomicrobium marinum]
MTTKKDEPGKDPIRPGETAGGKKPVATIDLKATEVGGSKSQTSAEGAKPADAKASSEKPSPDKTTASATASSSAGASSGGAKPTETASSGKSVPPSDAKKPDAKESKPNETRTERPRSGGGFLSHLTAGIVGGFLALLGADMLGPQIPPIADKLGLPSAAHKTSETTAEIERRLAALEKATKSEDVTSRLAATDSRIDALEDLKKSVSALQETQSGLAQKAEALDAKLQAAPEGTVPEARLTKLEQQLDTLVSSAGDGNTNGLPQLAALSGRLSDLETSLGNQIAALRESVGQDVDKRVAGIAEVSESARSGTQRLDRQVATVTTEAARLGQRLEALKADNTRITDTLRVVQEETGAIRSQLDAFTGDVNQKLSKLTTAEDVSSAIKPVEAQISNLSDKVSGVVSAEKDRQANAQRIVLSLELANLKRAVDRGEGYAGELAEVRKASTGVLDLKALEPYETAGVPTLKELEDTFRPVANDIIDAAAVPEDGSVLDQLIAGARSVVRVRKVNHDPSDQSVEAIVGRISTALSAGRLGEVLKEAAKLPYPAHDRAAEWIKTVEARHAVDQALGVIEGQLKASISGASAPSDANAN